METLVHERSELGQVAQLLRTDKAGVTISQLRKKQLPPPLPDPAFDTISRDDLEQF